VKLARISALHASASQLAQGGGGKSCAQFLERRHARRGEQPVADGQRPRKRSKFLSGLAVR